MKEFCVDSVSSGDGLNSTSGLNFTQRPGVVCMPQDNTMQKEVSGLSGAININQKAVLQNLRNF